MTDSRVYAVASGKGGVGKTTSAVNLGAAFVEAGRSVVVVDLDLGMANLDDFLDVGEPVATLHDVLAGDGTIDEALLEAPGGFDVMVGSDDFTAFGTADPKGLREVVNVLRTRYDVIVLDTGGGLSHDTALPLGLADGVVLVSTPDHAAINNTAKTRVLVDRLDGHVEGLVLTRIRGAGDDAREMARDRLAVSILGSVPEDSAIPESAVEGTPLVTLDRDSPAAQSYREIAYALLDEPLPRDWADDPTAATGGPATVVDDAGESVETAEPDEGSGDDDDAILEGGDAGALIDDDEAGQTDAEPAGSDDDELTAGDIAEAIEAAEAVTGEEDDILVAESTPPEAADEDETAAGTGDGEDGAAAVGAAESDEAVDDEDAGAESDEGVHDEDAGAGSGDDEREAVAEREGDEGAMAHPEEDHAEANGAETDAGDGEDGDARATGEAPDEATEGGDASDDETGDDSDGGEAGIDVDRQDDEDEEERSFLSRLTGGLFG